MERLYYKPLQHHTGYQLVRNNYKWGLIDVDGHQLLDYVYDYITEKNDGTLILNYDGHRFNVVIDSLPLVYDFATPCKQNGYRIAKKGDKYGVINEAGDVIIPIQQIDVKELGDYFWVNDGETPKGKYWVYSLDGHRLSPEPLFLQPYIGGNLSTKLNLPFVVTEYEDGYREKSYNILNKDFRQILPFDYNFNDYLCHNRHHSNSHCVLGFWVKKGHYRPAGLMLFSLKDGKLINKVYSDIEDLGYSVFLCYRPLNPMTAEQFLSSSTEDREQYVKQKDVIDVYRGSELKASIACDGYDHLEYINDNLFTARSIESGKYGFLNSDGICIPFVYDFLIESHRYIKAMKNCSAGREIREYEYQMGFVSTGLFDVFNDKGACVARDLSNRTNSLTTFDLFPGFTIDTDGSTCFELFNSEGKSICKARELQGLFGGFIVKGADNKYGIINYEGEVIYPIKAIKISHEKNDFVKAQHPDRVCYLYVRGDSVTEYNYKNIKKSKEFLIAQSLEGLWGVLNQKMDVLIPCKYEENDIYVISKSYIKVRNQFFNENGENVEASEEIIQACKNDYPSYPYFWGKTNSKGELLTKEKYPQINKFDHSYSAARNAEGKWGLLDIYGDEVYPFSFSFIFQVYPGGYAQVENEDGYCLVNSKGQPLFPFGYTDADYNKTFITPDDVNRTFVVQYKHKYGIMGPGYQILVPCIYDSITSLGYCSQQELFEKGFAIFKKGESNEDEDYVGLLRIQPHKIVLPCQYKSIELYDDDVDYRPEFENYNGPTLFRCEWEKGKEAIINTEGETLYSTEDGKIKLIVGDYMVETNPSRYDENAERHCYIYSISQKRIVAKYKKAGGFNGRYLQVLGENGWGLFDITTGIEAISCNYFINSRFYPYQFYPSDGLIPAQKGDLCGFIDMSEEWIIEPQFTDIGRFSEGLAAVQINEKWGYIDKEMNVIIPPTFDGAWEFSEGLAVVKKSKSYGYIDYNGKVVIGFNFSSAGSFDGGFAEVSTHNGEGYITKSGRKTNWESYDSHRSSGWSSRELDELRNEAMGWESWDDAACDLY